MPRNLYCDDEPIAMLATAELAQEIAERLNLTEELVAALEAVMQYAEFSNPKHRGRSEFQHAHALLARARAAK